MAPEVMTALLAPITHTWSTYLCACFSCHYDNMPGGYNVMVKIQSKSEQKGLPHADQENHAAQRTVSWQCNPV